MDTIYYIYINSNNSKASDPHKLLLNLTDKINLKRIDKYVALSHFSICYTWRNKNSYSYMNFYFSMYSIC